MAAPPPPPPPPPPIISPAPPSDDDDDDDATSSSSSSSASYYSDSTPVPSSVPIPPPPPPAPPNVPVTGADVAGGDTAPPVKDDRKLWERPWSIKELKSATESWTLAADAGLLLFMKEFSQRVMSKTHEIEKQVDSLVHEAKNTDTRAGNIFNDFMMLSNIQFVENRVYEENEDDEGKEKEESVQAQSEERPAEEKQMEVVGKIREAVSCGLRVLDEAFTKLEVHNDASSDDEDEAMSGYHEPILEARDPYALRPLPYLIGTSGFIQSEDVGIGDYESESEGDEEEEEYSTDEDEPQARQQTNKLYEEGSSDELFEPSDKESEEGEKRGGVAEPFASGSSSDEGSSSAGEFMSEDEDDKKTPAPPLAPQQMDLQAELNARLGVTKPAPVTTTTGEGSEFESSMAPSESVSAAGGGTKKRKKKKKKKKSSEDNFEESTSKPKEASLFMPAEEDDDEGTPFGQQGNIFGSSKAAKGLFDESDDDDEKTFSAAISGTKKSEEQEPTDDAEDLTARSSTSSLPGKKKLPAGAVPMFGASGLFTSEVEKSVTFDDASLVKSEGSPVTAKKKKEVSSLFDGGSDDDEESGLFSTKKASSSGTKASPTTAPKPRRQKSSSTSSDVFDDKDGRGGLFASDQPSGSPSRKKKPVGGVSIFGPQPSFLTDSLRASKSEDDGMVPGLTADSSAVSQPTLPPVKPKTAAAPASSSGGGGGGGGLFDESDGEGDLFTALASQKSKPKGKPPVGGVSVFGAVTDELTGSSKEPEASPIVTAPHTLPVTSTAPTKKSGGLFSDGTESDDDGGLFITKPITTTTAAPKTSAKPTTSKDPFGSLLSSDDDYSLFSSVSKPPPPAAEQTQPTRAEEPKATNRPKTIANKDPFGLIDDDDDDNLFASVLSKPKAVEKKQAVKTVEKAPAGEATTPGKKKPVSRLGGLFDQGNDDDDGDDLFGGSNFGFGSKPSTARTSEQPKASAPPPTAPKTKKPTTDDLFTASTDSGNVARDPSQGDVITEPAKPQKKKPVGAVPMFGGVDLFGGKTPTVTAAPSVEVKQEREEAVTTSAPKDTEKPLTVGGLFGSPTSEDDEIFSFKPKKAPVKTPVAQPPPEQDDNDELFASVKPSKLKSAVSLDAPTMRPKPAKGPVLEKSVSFEEPQKADTLTSLTKNRAVRQGGRRPPSRRSIKAQSDSTPAGVTTDMTSSTQLTPSRQLDADPLGFGIAGSKPDTIDDLFAASSTVLPTAGAGSTTRKAKKPVPKPTAAKEPAEITKDILFGNDDLLAESPPKESPIVVDQRRVTEIEKQIEKEMQEDDDLFSSKVLGKPTATISDELFGTPAPMTTTPPQPTATAPINKDVTDAASKKPVDEDDDDELFPLDDKHKPKKEKTSVKKKKSAVTDEDLFGNTDDIFGGVPKDTSKATTGKTTKAKSGKGKKKKKASSKTAAANATPTTTNATPIIANATATSKPNADVHDGVGTVKTTETLTPAPENKNNDLEDSLFGEADTDAKKAKAMKKKAKKKSEPKDYSMFDTDAPSIFDDPLNADK